MVDLNLVKGIKVYVVWYENYEGGYQDLVGVYTTLDKAKKSIIRDNDRKLDRDELTWVEHTSLGAFFVAAEAGEKCGYYIYINDLDYDFVL